ncbi:uncharacterized protein N7477_001550 [Penicillium maclennaniae]|uniref:uncharacterized protein n=1 Tax=Penicillium maclennaniae TaxID=1343394 RepID=UPI00253FB6E6|nr:uncharacterized protein N7477_001550 [Penicillium maclennaniae]KAJ5681610.1 hypothetical protein N7477_001550 [Penicillium maclennaniae]
MSTSLITYLNYMSTWDSESDGNIDKVIDEHNLFVNLGDFDSDTAVNNEFTALVDLAMTVRDETIAADAIQISADAAAVASIWSFGLGMAAFAALEATHAIMEKIISDKSTELNNKLTTADTDISSHINDNVNLYVVSYKANNTLIASKAPAGLDTRTCRSLLMQFMAEVQKRNNGNLTTGLFKQYAESARILYNSPEINNVYDAFDTLNLSGKTDQDIQQFMSAINGFTGFDTTAISLVRGAAVVLMFYKLRIASSTIEANAREAGFEVAEVETSTFGMLDAFGKFVAVVAVVMSVVDTVLEILDIVDVVEQCKTMCDKLNGPIKASYIDYFNGIKEASKQYKAAITPGPPPPPIGPTADFQLPLNLDQALELSLNVPSRANVPTLLANLSTNANQWEPGEFANGVQAWSPNVFGLHNAGANLGSAQRFAYIGVASQAPFTLKQFQVQIDTNAHGASAANPVVIAVELSSANDFAGYSTIGTIQSHHTNPQSLTTSQSIPAGLTYIRLRVTSPIPDGSNYIAYSKIVLSGSVQATGSIPALNPHAPIPTAKGASFALAYDFQHASDNALLVGVTAPAPSELISLLATNAQQWEPGEFNNGGE